MKETEVNAHAQGGRHGTALQEAAALGHTSVVQLLVGKGADVNTHAQGGRHGTALQATSAEGHKQVVQMLLERGADPGSTRADQSRVLPRLNTGDPHAPPPGTSAIQIGDQHPLHQVQTTQQPEQPSSPLYFHHWSPPDSQSKSKDKDQHLPEAESRSS